MFNLDDEVRVRRDAKKIRKDWRGLRGRVETVHSDGNYTVRLENGGLGLFVAEELETSKPTSRNGT
jgi:hypothetical protein